MIAHEIQAMSRNADDAEQRANDENPTVFEGAVYRFRDGSVLVIDGPQVNAYDDEAAVLQSVLADIAVTG